MIQSEIDYLTISQAAKMLPGRPHAYSVLRWIREGLKAPDGRKAYLMAVKMGGRWFTTRANLEAFREIMTPRPRPRCTSGPGEPQAGPIRLPARQKRRRHNAAMSRLEAAGILQK